MGVDGLRPVSSESQIRPKEAAPVQRARSQTTIERPQAPQIDQKDTLSRTQSNTVEKEKSTEVLIDQKRESVMQSKVEEQTPKVEILKQTNPEVVEKEVVNTAKGKSPEPDNIIGDQAGEAERAHSGKEKEAVKGAEKEDPEAKEIKNRTQSEITKVSQLKLREQVGELDKLIAQADDKGLDKEMLMSIKEKVINSEFAKFDITKATPQEIKAFAEKFKEVTKHDKFLVGKFGDTANVYKSLDKLVATIEKNPGDAKAQLKAIAELQVSLNTFVDKHQSSSKIGWMNVLDDKIGQMFTDIIKADMEKNPAKKNPIGDFAWGTFKYGEDSTKAYLNSMGLSKNLLDTVVPKFHECLLKEYPIQAEKSPDCPANFTFDKITANGKQYKLEAVLGEGSFGWVCRFSHTDENGEKTSIAVKLFKNQTSVDDLSAILHELDVHRDITFAKEGYGKSNTVPLLGGGRSPGGEMFVIMPEADGGSVKNIVESLHGLKTQHGDTLLPATVQNLVSRHLAQGMNAGISYMHGINAAHLDIKPENALYDTKSGQVKVMDFGTSHSEEIRSKGDIRGIGSPIYMSPQSLADKFIHDPDAQDFKSVGKKADVYSMGQATNVIITGKLQQDLKGSPWRSMEARINQADAAEKISGLEKELETFKETQLKSGKSQNQIDDMPAYQKLVGDIDALKMDATVSKVKVKKEVSGSEMEELEARAELESFVSDKSKTGKSQVEIEAMPEYQKLKQRVTDVENVITSDEREFDTAKKNLVQFVQAQKRAGQSEDQIEAMPEYKALSKAYDTAEKKVYTEIAQPTALGSYVNKTMEGAIDKRVDMSTVANIQELENASKELNDFTASKLKEGKTEQQIEKMPEYHKLKQKVDTLTAQKELFILKPEEEQIAQTVTKKLIELKSLAEEILQPVRGTDKIVEKAVTYMHSLSSGIKQTEAELKTMKEGTPEYTEKVKELEAQKENLQQLEPFKQKITEIQEVSRKYVHEFG